MGKSISGLPTVISYFRRASQMLWYEMTACKLLQLEEGKKNLLLLAKNKLQVE
jgi:hypothetical protein